MYRTISYMHVGISRAMIGGGGRRDFWQSGGSRGELMQGTNELL